MESPDQIRAQVNRYLAGEIPLFMLDDWFVDVLWDADPDHDPEVSNLVGGIHIALAEYSRGDRSLDSMKIELANAIRRSFRRRPVLGGTTVSEIVFSGKQIKPSITASPQFLSVA